MKINFEVKSCTNPGVAFAVKRALETQGFRVIDCGFGVGPLAGQIDLICEPPVDFIDAVPDMVKPFAQPGGDQ